MSKAYVGSKYQTPFNFVQSPEVTLTLFVLAKKCVEPSHIHCRLHPVSVFSGISVPHPGEHSASLSERFEFVWQMTSRADLTPSDTKKSIMKDESLQQ